MTNSTKASNINHDELQYNCLPIYIANMTMLIVNYVTQSYCFMKLAFACWIAFIRLNYHCSSQADTRKVTSRSVQELKKLTVY